MEKALELGIGDFGFGRESSEPADAPDLLNILRARFASALGRTFDKPCDQKIDQPAKRFLKMFARGGAGELSLGLLESAREARHAFGGEGRSDEARRHRVIEIGSVVGDLIGKVDQLGFDGRAESWQIFIEQRILAALE